MYDGLKDFQTEELKRELALRGFRVCRKPQEAIRCTCGHLPIWQMRGGKDIENHYSYICGNCGRRADAKTSDDALREWNKMIWWEES